MIKNGEIVADPWCLLVAGAEALASATVIKPQLLLPLARWVQELELLEKAGYAVGVWLAPDDEPEALIPRLAQIPVIAIQFPSFTDGRGYSLARLLRQRYGFRGELRAFGDILRDQIYFLHQCGFNAFCLRPDQDIEAAVAALEDYSWLPVAGR
ncbi:MAG: DUF934 domain-containing protein [Azonexus sp.]|nr:DUF934 domain-containing protein [Azonexus sp.]